MRHDTKTGKRSWRASLFAALLACADAVLVLAAILCIAGRPAGGALLRVGALSFLAIFVVGIGGKVLRDPASAAAWWHRRGRFGASHGALTLLAATMLVPFLWMVLASFKRLEEVEALSPLPDVWQPGNYPQVFAEVPFGRYYFNSIFVAAWVTFLQCLTSSMAAYAFSRLRWRGRDHVFRLYLATLMIPGVVTMIPNYTLIVKLRLLDSYAGLIVPAAFSAFGTFLLRQFMLTIPPSLDEAAAIDGASHWQIFWDVILPLARPGLITLAIFTFLGNYGSFFWPLILIKSEHLRTLPIGMLYFDTMYGRQTNLIMAASVMNIIPLVILFIVSQKFIVKGIQLGAVKG
ncbi:MAG: carbohydrate ABC transporter permease [Planctomycetes bacterium]|nr:carbohydrate ABC transporter permease [Planctomycetota bacterium]